MQEVGERKWNNHVADQPPPQKCKRMREEQPMNFIAAAFDKMEPPVHTHFQLLHPYADK